MKFRMVDRITAWEPWTRIAGTKTVSFEEYSLRDAFGEPPRLPESLLLESFLQLGNWLVLLSSDFTRMGLVARMARVEWNGMLLPGQRLDMTVHMEARRESGFLLSGEGNSGGRALFRGSGCLATPVPATDYVDPDHLRVLFSEIHVPGAS